MMVAPSGMRPASVRLCLRSMRAVVALSADRVGAVPLSRASPRLKVPAFGTSTARIHGFCTQTMRME